MSAPPPSPVSSAASFKARVSPPSVDDRTCHKHGNAAAAARCGLCLRGLCEACIVLDPDGTRCRSCLASSRAEHGKQRFHAMVLGLLALGSLVGAARVMRPAPDIGERAAALAAALEKESETLRRPDGLDYGVAQYQANALLRRVQNSPCDFHAVDTLAGLQVGLHHVAHAEALARATLAGCGDSPVLHRHLAEGLFEQHQFAAAADEMDVALQDTDAHDIALRAMQMYLAAERNDDAIALGWRLFLERPETTAADFLVHALEGAQMACDAQMVAAVADVTSDEPRDMQALKSCGLASGTLHLEHRAFVLPAPVRLNGKLNATMMVDLSFPVSMISRTLAEKLGMETAYTLAQEDEHGPVVLHRATRVDVGQLRSKTPTGGISAGNVLFRVTDELPEGVDGIIGHSLLWRFDANPVGQGPALDLVAPH